MQDNRIEQIDYLRSKAGLTYEEAVAQLERYDGDLTQCMIELERQGRIRPASDQEATERQGYSCDPHKHRGSAFVLDWEGIKRLLFSRVSVRKGDLIVTNLTVLAWLFVLIAAPWVLITGVIATFFTGCKIKWNKTATDPNLDIRVMMGQAAENIRRTADSFVTAVKSEDSPIAPSGHTDTAPQDDQ